MKNNLHRIPSYGPTLAITLVALVVGVIGALLRAFSSLV